MSLGTDFFGIELVIGNRYLLTSPSGEVFEAVFREVLWNNMQMIIQLMFEADDHGWAAINTVGLENGDAWHIHKL
jgi:hypothetical protein